MTNKSENEYISLKHAAERTDLSVKTLRRRIDAGVLPARRSGRLIRVRLADLEEMFNIIPSAAQTGPVR